MDRDEDYIDFNDDSDPCEADSSSDDELDIIFQKTPQKARKLQLTSKQRKDSDSEDEFEKEMNRELNATVKALESQRRVNAGASYNTTGESSDKTSEAATTGSGVDASGTKHCDDIYFDSDEEEMVTQGDERVKRRNSLPSNDELLYDPKMDDEDQKWVDKRRQKYQPKRNHPDDKPRRLPQSDAVLDCPACMSTLCLDCQRHEKFHNQYRAMFVSNCRVDTSERLKIPQQKPKKSKKKHKKVRMEDNSEMQENTDLTQENESDMFHPVRCTECSTVVGVYDKEEVYHFFNVLASYG